MYKINKSANGTVLVPIEVVHFSQRIVYLEGEINADSALRIQKELADLALTGNEPVLLVVSSPGGSVQSGLSICGTIKSLSFKVDTLVLDVAASMGAVVACCATGTRYMSSYAKLFLHEPLVRGVEDGSLSGIKSTLESLKDCQDRICELLVERTGRPLKDMKKAVSTDHYYSLDEAIENGFADSEGNVGLFCRYGKDSAYEQNSLS